MFAGALLAALAAGGREAGAQTSVRAMRPRIWLTEDGRRGLRPEVIRARCLDGQSAYARACRATTPVPMNVWMQPPIRNAEQVGINLALRYLLFEEASTLDFLRDQFGALGTPPGSGNPGGAAFLFEQAPKVRALAVAYDWLYRAITPSDRASYEVTLRNWGQFFLQAEPDDVFAAESYVQASTVGVVGLALSGEGAVAADAERFTRYAETRWKGVLLPALGYTRDWWHEGPALWFRQVAPAALYFASAWSTATGEDLFTWAERQANDPFGAAVRYAAYALRPDLRFATYGDATEAQLRESRRVRPVLDMLSWGTGSSVAQGMAEEMTQRLAAGSDYVGPELWHQLVFYDPGRPSMPARSSLPLAAHLSPTAEDAVVMRSSWSDDDATYITLSCGDFFSPRQHLEAGSFQIYRRAPLIVHTGTFDGFESPHWISWYAQRSVHANTLSVFQPSEVFANARMLAGSNDGGQRVVDYWSRPRPSVDAYRANLTQGAQYETASVTAFESLRFHDYTACDLTRAYNSTRTGSPGVTPKVREVTRQFLYLRPELVVIFDRIDGVDPANPRRFTLHGLSRPILDTTDGFAFGRGATRVLGRTLLPVMPERAVYEGFAVNGMRYDPLAQTDESTGARLEISTVGAGPSYFLHLLAVPSSASASLPPASRIEEGDRVGLRVADPDGSRVYQVLFARTGEVSGEIRVTAPGGEDLYRGRLGSGGVFYAPVTDAGVVRFDAGALPVDAGAAVDASPDAGAPGGADAQGCGCRVGAPSEPPGGAHRVAARLGLLLGAVGALRPRRRRASRPG
ncbi:MAG: hypothetical protein JNK72_05275 [Myxococcales bacterium]|nr:hypothetical protein [Myxococcales bacterium]